MQCTEKRCRFRIPSGHDVTGQSAAQQCAINLTAGSVLSVSTELMKIYLGSRPLYFVQLQFLLQEDVVCLILPRQNSLMFSLVNNVSNIACILCCVVFMFLSPD